jgi:hypothetical protein
MVGKRSSYGKDFRTGSIADTNVVCVTVNVIELAVTDIGANGTLEEWHGERK